MSVSPDAPAAPVRTSVYVDGLAHENPIPAASRIGNLVYTGLISGADPATGEIATGLAVQCRFMFAHMRAVIEAAGGSPADIIKVTLWMVDRAQREAVNREWVQMFPDPGSRPARHTIQSDLDGGKLVACDFIAVLADREPGRS